MRKILSPEQIRNQLFLYFLVIFVVQFLIHIHSLYSIIESNAFLIQSLYLHHHTLHLLQYSFNYILTYSLYWLSVSLILILPSYLLTYWSIFLFWITPLAIISSFLGILFLCIDQIIYQYFQFHISTHFLPILKNGDLLYFLHLSTLELLTMMAMMLSLLIFLILMNAFCDRKGRLLSIKFNLLELVGITLLAILLYLGYLSAQLIPSHRHILANQIDYYFGLKNLLKKTPLAQKIMTATESRAFPRLNHSQPIMKKTFLKSDFQTHSPHYNILWILVDTLRYDYINPQSMPYTFQFSQKSQVFQQHISSGNSTQPGFFGLFYGLPPSYFSSTVTHHTQPMLFDVLQALNYQFAIFWSGTIHCPPFIQNIFSQLPSQNIHMTRLQDVSEEDKRSTALLIHFLKHHDLEKPFFNVIMFNSVHGYCNTQKFADGAYQSCYRFNLNNHSDPTPLQNRYQRATRYVDEKINDILKNVDLKHTIVLITSDHGESFNDYHNNLWGHAHAFTPNLTHVPLIIHWPQQPAKIFKKITTHYDVSPTFLEYFTTLSVQNLKPYQFGQSLYSKQVLSQILLGSYANTAIWDIPQKQITILHPDGDVTLSDLQNQPIYHRNADHQVLKDAFILMSQYYQRNLKK